MGTRVVHCKRDDYDVYVGRKDFKFHFGNPFSHKDGTLAEVMVETREDAVRAFEDWLAGRDYHDVEPLRREWILSKIHVLQGYTLGCWCAPQACHGDVLARWADTSR